MYNVTSKKAEEFISDSEIRDTMEYAASNRNNREVAKQILEKARAFKGISHREAAVLLECDQPDIIEEIYELAREIKRRFYGNRIVMFAPLYLSNYWVNGCVFC
ncbi:MAG: [Bacteroidaceae bacterium]|nr:[FeFe] hydrogenase H-cluster radical SAM maturase HydG [Bacteroidaceae bacterium]